MKAAKVRLALAAGLFFAWIGWLAYLALTTARPVVLSRPQFLDSKLDVIADVTEQSPGSPPAPQVVVREVRWPETGQEALIGHPLTVTNLGQATGWTGPGWYILPLVPADDGKYQISPIPASPGFEGRNPLRIYVANPETLQQLQEIRAEK